MDETQSPLVPVVATLCSLIVLVGVVVTYREETRASADMHVPASVTTSQARATSSDLVTQPIAPTIVSAASDTTATIRLLFVGDIMLDRNVAKRIKDSGDPAYPFEKLPPHWFDSFDYAVANLEGVVTDQRRPPEKSIDFMFDPSVVPMLKAQGIDAVSQANNHSLDQGTLGYEDSVRRLRAGGFLVFGHQVQDNEIAMATTTIKGERFAFLGFNTTDNPLDRDAAARVLAEAHQQADHVLVFMHWGLEYRHAPPASVVDEAHWLIDHGADVVIGGHPHWVQGMESYKDKPIMYSLGNFVFDQDFSKETTEGMAMEVDFSHDMDGVTLNPIPIDITLSQPSLATGTDREEKLQALASYSDMWMRPQIENFIDKPMLSVDAVMGPTN